MIANDNNIRILGIPFSGGQPRGGVDAGPKALRDAGIVNTLQSLGWKVASDSDVIIPPLEKTQVDKLKNPHWVGKVCKDVFEKVYENGKGGDICLNLGGDHSIATGTIAAVLKNNPDAYIVWVDAHADINTPTTTESGNLHGMPVSFLAKIAGEIEGFEYLKGVPALRTDRLVYVGLRDVDPGEEDILAEHKIKHYRASDVAKMGIAAISNEILEFTKGAPIHMSFDVDALDPEYAPATGTPVREGMTLEDGKHLCSALAGTGRLVSMDVVEVNPHLSDSTGAHITVTSAIQLVQAAFPRRA